MYSAYLDIINGDDAVSSSGGIVVVRHLDCIGGRWNPLPLCLLVNLEDMSHDGKHSSLPGQADKPVIGYGSK